MGRPGARLLSSQRGVVLILAIFAVALLTTLAVGISIAVRSELKAAHAGLERMQELFLAQAGIDVTRAILVYEDLTYDALTDDWGPDSQRPLDDPQPLGEGYYRVRVYDACGRIDINHADPETLLRLTEDPDLVEEILRWREGQANDGDYLSLAYPYLPRRGFFQSVGELLLVQGMTPEVYFGDEKHPPLADLVTVEAISPNTDAKGRWRTSVRDMANASGDLPNFESWFEEYHAELLEIADAETWKRVFSYEGDSPTGTYESLAQLAAVLESYGALEALDYLTVSPDRYLVGLVNVNTAPREVLAVVPGGSLDLADAIIERRKAAPFVSLGELGTFLSSQEEGGQVLEQMVDHVTTKSSSFVIESTGAMHEDASASLAAGHSFHTVCAMVRRLDGAVHVVRQYEKGEPLPPREETVELAARR